MDPKSWAEVERLFEAISSLPLDQQRVALKNSAVSEEVRSQVAELVAFDGRIDLDQWGKSVQRLASQVERAQQVGAQVGAWRLIESLGEGGMGQVFLAERCDGRFEAQVAIKFVTARGGHDLELFDRERRLLARLNHPGIARLIDAGEDEQLGAYLVMEYVQGQPLSETARERRMDVLEIARWMSQVADIVAYAHQSLVLHRDLKPEHVLIDQQGDLKILDFGVAALLLPEQATPDPGVPTSFTPRYAAPEQLLNQTATTHTDVYALGLMLYELLSDGRSPFGEDREALVERKIRGQAEVLGTVPGLRPVAQQDLRAIIARAIALDPNQRYASPADLSADLRALSEDRAIGIRAPSRLQSAQRWLRHNRLAGAAMAMAGLAMMGGTVVSAWFGRQARIERDVAVVEATKAREIASFLESVFQASTPGLEKGPDVRARDLLEAGHERIGRELTGQPEVAAALELAIARSFLSLGLYQDALALLGQARPDVPAALLVDKRLLSARLNLLAGQYQAALELLDPAWLAALEGNTLANARNLQATALINLGSTAEAEQAARAGWANADSTDAGLELALVAQGLLGAIAFSRQDYPAARAAYDKIHTLNRARHGPVHEETAQALHNLAGVLFMSGDLAGATQTYEHALETKRAYYGVDNRSVAMTLRSLGLSYRREGRAMDAERTLREAVAALQSWNEPTSAVYQEAIAQLLELLALQERSGEITELLLKLPPARYRNGVQEKQIHCRIERFRASYTDGYLPDDRCADPVSGPPAIMAFDLFLEARRSNAAGAASAAADRQAAIEAASQLTPPDPMLRQAIEKLGSRVPVS